jgi:hypothetical protein
MATTEDNISAVDSLFVSPRESDSADDRTGTAVALAIKRTVIADSSQLAIQKF